MSSFRCQRNTHKKIPRENESSCCLNRNNVPGLLRLDSTGEVTSAYQVPNCQKPTVEKEMLKCRDTGSSKTNNYKNLVENLNMGTLINSASACFCSAKTYIESFYPYKTSKGFVRGKSDSSSIGYLRNMLDTNNHSKMNDTDLQSVPSIGSESVSINCNCAKTDMNQETDKPLKWPGNIFGAIQCNLLSNCSPGSGKMKNVEKYVPPQRRCVQSETNNIATLVDPKLTPYNARLLEKSKRLHSHEDVKRECVDHGKHFDAYSPKVCKRKLDKSEQDLNVNHHEKVENCKKVQGKVREIEFDHMMPNASKSLQVTADNKTEESENDRDWFEYECDNVNCIPIPFEKIQVATQKCATNDCAQGSDAKIQQPHSWFSAENGYEDVLDVNYSAAKDESSLMKNETETREKAIDSMQERKLYNVDKKSDKFKTDSLMKVKNSQNDRKQDSSSDYEVKDDISRTENDNFVSDNNLISVLYVRSLGKKGRPSAKKRRRQKAQQNENNEQALATNDKSSSDKKPDCASQSNSAVAFILGYDDEHSENSLPSFHVSCDMDCDSDWTESDCESDENCSSLEEENLFESELGFQCNDLLRNMHFTLTCTMQPTDNPTQSSNSSAIDDINMSWRVQVSVEPESHKSKSSKKVHFPDDNDLTTVHLIIAWSYAYQAARKGPWEQHARDRGRFLRRITDANKVLEPILNKNHRDKVFGERFCDNCFH